MLYALFPVPESGRDEQEIMELDLKAAAALMNVSERAIYKWVHEQGLPAHCVNEQYRFSRVELLEWATAQGLKVSPALFTMPAAPGSEVAGFESALAAGGVHHNVFGADKQAVIAEAIRRMPLPEDMDRDLLLDIILARESLGSTGIGDGVAIPHVRNPIVMNTSQPLMSLCFLAAPVDFDAMDGQPVHTLFMIICPTIKMHLHLIARLSFALRQPVFSEALRERKDAQEILKAAAGVDAATVPRVQREPAE
jgi:PTS system nitrogen regulatory IIA component